MGISSEKRRQIYREKKEIQSLSVRIDLLSSEMSLGIEMDGQIGEGEQLMLVPSWRARSLATPANCATGAWGMRTKKSCE